jgi:hypothetical protein
VVHVFGFPLLDLVRATGRAGGWKPVIRYARGFRRNIRAIVLCAGGYWMRGFGAGKDGGIGMRQIADWLMAKPGFATNLKDFPR